MPPAISKRDRLDELMDGKLESYVRARRATFASWDRVARDLHGAHGVEVTGESLRQWFPESKTGEAS